MSATLYTPIVNAILAKEAGFVDHPSDSGGATNWGVTQAVARANGYMGDMRLMPEAFARHIYEKRYITEPRFNQVAEIDPEIGLELIDTGVNMGPSVAAVYFQRALNVFNLRGSKYADLFVDGRIGPASLDAFRKYLAWRGRDGKIVMLRTLNNLQGVNYVEIAERRPKDEDFVFGQILHRVA